MKLIAQTSQKNGCCGHIPPTSPFQSVLAYDTRRKANNERLRKNNKPNAQSASQTIRTICLFLILFGIKASTPRIAQLTCAQLMCMFET